MSIKNLVVAVSLLIALSPVVSVTSWAASHEKAEAMDEGEAKECISEADLDALSDEDKAKQSLPVCADEGGEGTEPAESAEPSTKPAS